MRKITIITACLILTTLSAIADHMHESTVIVESWDHRPFEINIDGCNYPTDGFFRMDNLPAGNHWITVTRRKLACGYQGGFVETLFRGNVRIHPHALVTARVTAHNVRIIDVRPLHAGQSCGIASPWQSNNFGGLNMHVYGSGVGTYNDGFNNNLWGNGSQVVYGNEQIAHGVGSNSNYGNNYAAFGMPVQQFENLLSSINNVSFNTSKLNIAKQGVRNQRVTSMQVQRIMNALDYESSRLEFAEFAYQFTVDKENYFMVNNAFTFESSIITLSQFIHG